MNAKDYLQTLIDGQQMSTIPVTVSELKVLRTFMEQEEQDAARYRHLVGPLKMRIKLPGVTTVANSEEETGVAIDALIEAHKEQTNER